MASSRLSLIRVLWIRLLARRALRDRPYEFNDCLHRLYRAQFYCPRDLSKFENDYLSREDVKTYYREHMPYAWRANHKHGAVDLGICTRTEALRRLAQQMPKAEVLTVDPVFPFIFFKIGD
ncbi:MAG: hypothetical protein ACRD33_00015 [Candidatus Acidiferrales bacterium]